MENALLIGLSRQIALSRELDVVSNNIANMNTTGFKANNSVFQEYLMPVARENSFQAQNRQVSFVIDRATFHNLAQGPIQTTGNPLDVAIDGEAFLTVQTARGERYTRAGSLQISPTGQLVTSDGSAVLGDGGPIVMQPLDRDISITADGRVSVTEGANTKTESVRGKLRLVRFDNPQQLQKDGATAFLAPAGVTPQPDIKSRLVQGALEKSNVSSVAEMTRLIDVTRQYTDIASMLAKQGDLRKSAIQQLADVPA